MRLGYLSMLALVTACGGHLKRETIGSGATAVQARGSTDPAPAGSINLPRGVYELKLRFDVPRAQLVEWTVICPGAAQSGVAGETTEEYRARRIAELRAEKQRERERVAGITGAVIGAVTPDVHAHAQTNHATVDATVSGQAVGNAAGVAIANATVSDAVELAPGDVGAGRLKAKASVITLDSGTCTVSAIADDANVLASYEVVRVRDLDAEARARREADPKVQARIAIQMQLRVKALDIRGQLIRYFTGECHARADHREYLEEQPLVVRAAMREYLIALGAIERPPMPAPKPEVPGDAPYDGAEWVAGEWIWTGIEWQWEVGVWRDASVATVRDHRTSDTSDRDHRSDPLPTVRDHRDETVSRDHRSEPVVRDHRDEPKPHSTPVVRDHRKDDDDKKKDDDAPKVRDHRH
ncbi:MAG TPA: hypothetical protein VFV99_18090 [Kofleriaceae bacterium]|nr:hypothetical protein [Kofleriaceae bacterium]